MSKAKRLNEMIMMVNRKKRFTVGELAQEFGVSKRTVLRDLQELSELGVPLYSETGPHGGYQVLNERILPPSHSARMKRSPYSLRSMRSGTICLSRLIPSTIPSRKSFI